MYEDVLFSVCVMPLMAFHLAWLTLNICSPSSIDLIIICIIFDISCPLNYAKYVYSYKCKVLPISFGLA